MSRKSKYNPEECADIKDWVETVVGEPLPSGDPIGVLKDGVALCRLVNSIRPKSANFKASKMPFVQMENISSFLRACEKFGVEQHELFETVDLYEMKDPIQVAITLRSLSRHAHLINPSLPVIGPKLKQTPTKQQQYKTEFKNDKAEVPAWSAQQYGYLGGASQSTEGVVIGARPNVIHKEVKSATRSPSIMIQRDTSVKNFNSSESPARNAVNTPTKPEVPHQSPIHESRADRDENPEEETSISEEANQSWQYSPEVSRKASTSPNASVRSPPAKPDFTFTKEEEQEDETSDANESQTAGELGSYKSTIEEEKDDSIVAEQDVFNSAAEVGNLSIADSEIDLSRHDDEMAKPVSAFSPSPQRSPFAKSAKTTQQLESPTRNTRISLGDDSDEEQEAAPKAPPISINLRPAAKPKGPRTFQPSPIVDSSSVFGREDESDDDHRNNKGKHNLSRGRVNQQLIQYGKDSLKQAAEIAEELDSSVFAYDEVYDVMKEAEKKGTSKPSNHDNKQVCLLIRCFEPRNTNQMKARYIDNLLESKRRRELDRQRAKDVQLRRERELEGDEFAGKEAFVTGAYKKQQEELERQRREDESKESLKAKGIGSFRAAVIDRQEEERAQVLKAIQDTNKIDYQAHSHEPSDNKPSLSEEIRKINEEAGYEKVKLNDDGELIDSRQLLKGGLNLPSKPKVPSGLRHDGYDRQRQFSKLSSASNTGRSSHTRSRIDLKVQQEKSDLEQKNRDEEKNKAVVSSLMAKKSESSVSSARERYLARKKATEAANKDQLYHKPATEGTE